MLRYLWYRYTCMCHVLVRDDSKEWKSSLYLSIYYRNQRQRVSFESTLASELMKKDSRSKMDKSYVRYIDVPLLLRSGNISNLKSHLNSQLQQTEPSTLTKVNNPKRQDQPSNIAASFEKSLPFSHQSKRWKDLNKAVAYFNCKDRLPIYTVEKEGFRALVGTLDNRYEVPSRVHFSNSIIPELYVSTKGKVAQLLSKVKRFAGTTDLWSSIGLKPYLGYTIYFVDEEWKLQSVALSTSFLPEDHTTDNIADALQETLDEWKLSSVNQVCLTIDSGANVVAATNKLNWIRLSCFGHKLHLGITKALARDRRYTRALGVAHKIVSAFSCSWKRQRDLTQAQTTLNISKHSLITVSFE